jgi:hypothetical protein
LNYFIGGSQQRFGDGEAERLGLEVDDELEFCRKPRRKIAWLRAAQNRLARP